MKKLMLYAAAALALTACSQDAADNGGRSVDDANVVKATVAPFKVGGPTTRVSVTPSDNNGADFSWENGDKLGVFSTVDWHSNYMEINTISSTKNIATFTSEGFQLQQDKGYIAFYPDMESKYAEPVLTMDYTTQTQTANEDYVHLKNYDLLRSESTTPATTNTIGFSMKHLGAVVGVYATVPVAGTYKELRITHSGDDQLFYNASTIDLKSGTISGTMSNTISLKLGSGGNGLELAESAKLKAYLMVGTPEAVDLTDRTLTVTLVPATDGADDIVYNAVNASAVSTNSKFESAYMYWIQPSYGTSLNGHEYVDLDLPSGTLWATTNVGADTPEGYGEYFAWGETTMKTDITLYGFDKNTKYYNASYSGNDYYTKYHQADGKTTLEAEDDAATANWGTGWSTPTRTQWEELNENCTNSHTTQNGVEGYLFTSKNNGNTLFLPMGGKYCSNEEGNYGTKGILAYNPETKNNSSVNTRLTNYANVRGYYMTSTLATSSTTGFTDDCSAAYHFVLLNTDDKIGVGYTSSWNVKTQDGYTVYGITGGIMGTTGYAFEYWMDNYPLGGLRREGVNVRPVITKTTTE